MKHRFAALLFAMAAILAMHPAVAQQAKPAEAERSKLGEILKGEISPESLALAKQLVKLTNTDRTFDELLPNIAAEAKNGFIRANPQMQLGIIDVVDRVALDLVKRRPELDEYLARVWASGFSDDEMQELIDFYSTDTGKKYAELHPQLLGVELAAAQEWGRSITRELTARVSAELKSTMAAEQKALQGDTAGPAAAAPAQ